MDKEELLSAIETFGIEQRGYRGMDWWYRQSGSTLWVESIGKHVTVVETIDNSGIDSYGSRWGAYGGASVVVAVTGDSDSPSLSPTYYKITGDSTSFGVDFSTPTIKEVAKREEVVSHYE